MLRSRSLSTDDELLRRLSAPPNLDDGMRSLEYWRRRERQLPWYQVRARREASRMIVLWEQRVGAALLAQSGEPLPVRLSAGMLLARTRLSRWGRRAGLAFVAAAMVATLIMAAVIAALIHAL